MSTYGHDIVAAYGGRGLWALRKRVALWSATLVCRAVTATTAKNLPKRQVGPVELQYGLEGSTDVNKIAWSSVSIDSFDDDTGSSILLVEDDEQCHWRPLSPIFQVAGRWFTGALSVRPETLSRNEPIRQGHALPADSAVRGSDQ